MIQFTAKPETMRTIVDVLSVIVDEARMRFSSDGLDINVVDASHVALIKMHVDAAAFETWDVLKTKKDAQIILGNHLDNGEPLLE